MANKYVLLVCFALVTLGSSVLSSSSDYPDENRLSAEDENDVAGDKEDYPDLDDLSSFFDFDLVPSREAGSNRKRPVRLRPNLSKHYYYYKATDSFYRGDSPPHIPPQDKSKQVVTPGSHYKPENDQATTSSEPSSNDSKDAINRFVMGNYQVSVVNANSPELTKLGLNKGDLDKLTVLSKRSTNIMGSDSIHSPTYAENPRPQYDHPSYSHPPPSYDSSRYSQHSPPERHHRPNSEYYPEDKPPYSPGHSPSSYSHPSPSGPPPQGSYDPKSYKVVRDPPHRGSSGYSHPPPRYDSYPPPASHTSKRGSGEPWRPRVTHTDWDDKDRKQEYQESDTYPPHPLPLPHRDSSSNSGPYSKPSYSSHSSSDKPGYNHPETYSKPKTTYGPSPSSSSDYHAYKPSYHSSSGYSTSKSTPSRAGSADYSSSSYHSHPEPSKPGITIKFKAKSPGGHGLNIPLSFNPLDVAKKLLPISALNPLHNKKITIGITIENKKEQHHDYHAY